MDSIFHRVSIRHYKTTTIEPEKIELMLRAAMQAPSAHNQQPWEYYVVTNREIIDQLSEATPYTGWAKGAPRVFVACSRSLKELKTPPHKDIDMSASVENLLLEADSLGLGAVWMGVAPEVDRMEKVREIISLPKRLDAFAIISVGYPDEDKPQISRYEESRVHYIR